MHPISPNKVVNVVRHITNLEDGKRILNLLYELEQFYEDKNQLLQLFEQYYFYPIELFNKNFYGSFKEEGSDSCLMNIEYCVNEGLRISLGYEKFLSHLKYQGIDEVDEFKHIPVVTLYFVLKNKEIYMFVENVDGSYRTWEDFTSLFRNTDMYMRVLHIFDFKFIQKGKTSNNCNGIEFFKNTLPHNAENENFPNSENSIYLGEYVGTNSFLYFFNYLNDSISLIEKPVKSQNTHISMVEFYGIKPITHYDFQIRLPF